MTAVSGPAQPPEPVRPTLTVADLERWADNGASWRAVEVTDERAVVELCTCFGEPVDLLSGETPELVAYVRARGLRSDADGK
jgi:hypothetical protein